MVTLVNPIMESIKDAFRFRGPESVGSDLRPYGPTGPFFSTFAGYYISRVFATLAQMLFGSRLGAPLQRLGDAGIGVLTGVIQVFGGRALVNQFPTMFSRDAFMGGIWLGTFQGIALPMLKSWAPDNRFLAYLSGAWDSGDFGGSYGAIPSLPMAGEIPYGGAYGAEEHRLGTAYYEDTSLSGPVPSGYDNAQLDAGQTNEEMLYSMMS